MLEDTHLTKREVPDRSKIDLHDPLQVKAWLHELGIGKRRLVELIAKVGNSAAAVRKELETDGGKSMAYPTDEEIKTRADQLWERAGRPEGRGDEFWQEAERELKDAQERREIANGPPSVLPG